jgi:hypothetical protein
MRVARAVMAARASRAICCCGCQLAAAALTVLMGLGLEEEEGTMTMTGGAVLLLALVTNTGRFALLDDSEVTKAGGEAEDEDEGITALLVMNGGGTAVLEDEMAAAELETAAELAGAELAGAAELDAATELEAAAELGAALDSSDDDDATAMADDGAALDDDGAAAEDELLPSTGAAADEEDVPGGALPMTTPSMRMVLSDVSVEVTAKTSGTGPLVVTVKRAETCRSQPPASAMSGALV